MLIVLLQLAFVCVNYQTEMYYAYIGAYYYFYF